MFTQIIIKNIAIKYESNSGLIKINIQNSIKNNQ